MHAEPGLEPPGQPAEQPAEEEGQQQDHRRMDAHRQQEVAAHQRGGHGADHVLPLRADVEKPALVGEGDR